MPNYKLSCEAEYDLIRIHQFSVQRFGMRHADNYFSTFFEYFDAIAQQPFSFEAVDHFKLGYRRCVCGSDSIYYRVNHDEVEIMTIIGRQDLDNI